MSTTETQVQSTPGPWTVWEPDEDSLEGQYEIVSEYFADGSKRFCPQMVAECFAESQEADARLIAAAPELLDACKRMMGLDDTCDYRNPGTASDPSECPGIAENGVACHWCYMRAAIAKATVAATPIPEGADR